MKTHDAELLKIKDLLRNNPKGMKITQIARDLAMNRNAAAKFLEILLMTGQVEMLEHGMSKIFILSRKTSIPTMLDRSSDFIIVLDRDMKISQVNDNFLKFSGKLREDLLGKRPDTIRLPVIGRQPLFDKIREAHYGTDTRTEVIETFSGDTVFFDVRLTPTIFNDGKQGITIIIEDITQQKKSERSLRKMVREILSCIDDAVILLDSRTGAVLFLNPAAEKMFGYKPEECVGKDFGFLFGVAKKPPVYSGGLQDTFGMQGYYETESLLKGKGSKEFPVTLHLRPIYDDQGGLRSIVMVIRDITSREVSNGVSMPTDTGNLHIPLSLKICAPDPQRYRSSI
jgi:PAS domain S-box-containing protein